MAIGLVGRKSGMTRVFTEDGASIPVTVVEVSPNRVTQIKELETDGYRAIQVTTGNRKASKVSKSEAVHFAKAGVEAGTKLSEFLDYFKAELWPQFIAHHDLAVWEDYSWQQWTARCFFDLTHFYDDRVFFCVSQLHGNFS